MHALDYLTFGARKTPKGITEECDKYCKRNSDYGGGLYNGIRFHDREVLKGYNEARAWLEEHDRGDYDNLACKYKESGRTYWLVKIEYHC